MICLRRHRWLNNSPLHLIIRSLHNTLDICYMKILYLLKRGSWFVYIFLLRSSVCQIPLVFLSNYFLSALQQAVAFAKTDVKNERVHRDETYCSPGPDHSPRCIPLCPMKHKPFSSADQPVGSELSWGGINRVLVTLALAVSITNNG